MGLATSAAFVALNHYFSRKRGQAVGLSMAGTGKRINNKFKILRLI